MIVIGVKHLINPQPFVQIVPPFIPHPLTLVYISGWNELLAGIGLTIPRLSKITAWILFVLFIAVFPANLYQAGQNIPVSGLPHDPPLIWLRFVMQILLISWAAWFTQLDRIEITSDRNPPSTSTY